MSAEVAATVVTDLRRASADRATPRTTRRSQASTARPARSSRSRATPYYATARLWDDGIIEP